MPRRYVFAPTTFCCIMWNSFCRWLIKLSLILLFLIFQIGLCVLIFCKLKRWLLSRKNTGFAPTAEGKVTTLKTVTWTLNMVHLDQWKGQALIFISSLHIIMKEKVIIHDTSNSQLRITPQNTKAMKNFNLSKKTIDLRLNTNSRNKIPRIGSIYIERKG